MPLGFGLACAIFCNALVLSVACGGDRNQHCRYWADNGHCKTSRAYMQSNCCQSCAASSSCQGDRVQHCSYWAQRGECNSNPAYMQQNCCKSCASGGRTCNDVWNVDAGGATCGARIVWLKQNGGMNDAGAKTQVANEFPNQCGPCKANGGGPSPTPSPTPACNGDRSEHCPYWAKQGYCQTNSAYMGPNCCRSCQRPTGNHCKPLSASSPKNRALNVVLVPSAFRGNMQLWGEKARWITDVFSQYKPFNAAQIPNLNIWYVDVDMPEDDGRQCVHGCFNIDRLLCCDGRYKFIAHARRHCGTGFIMNTLIIHNSNKYGGAGFTSDGAASCSTHNLAPQIAVHELGHSLLGLADEYKYGTHATPENSPNCDRAGCPKWRDLQGRWGVGCKPRKCKGGNYYASEDTMMDVLSFKFGEVNERISCCKYAYHFGSPPRYCDKFSQNGLNLRRFCATNLWKGEYTKLNDLSAGNSFGLDFGNASLTVSSQEAQMSYWMHAEQDTQGQGFVYVHQPTEWTVTWSSGVNDWICTKNSDHAEAGLYLKRQVLGDAELGSAPGRTLIVKVIDATGNIARELVFNTEEELEVPPDSSAGPNISDILQPRQSIPVVLNSGESCLLPSGLAAMTLNTGVAATSATGAVGASPAAPSKTPLLALSGAKFPSAILSCASVAFIFLMSSIAFSW